MFESYRKKITKIEKFYNQGDTENTVLSCGKLIEHVVSVIFSNFHVFLTTPEDRAGFVEFEKKWDKEYADFIKRPTTGRSLRYYNQLLTIFPEHLRISPDVKDDFNLVNSLRNSAAHAGSQPSDNDAYKALKATKSIISTLDMLDEAEDTIGLPLHIYLVYSSIKEKFSDAKAESDFGKIVSDAATLIPELMNIIIDRKYTLLSLEQKEKLIEQFTASKKCNLDFHSCHSFFIDSDFLSLYGKKSSDLKNALADILASEGTEEKNTRMGSRPYINAMDIMVDDLKENGTENFFNLADRIKELYLNDNQVSDEERAALKENAKMIKFDQDALESLIENVVKEIEEHLIKYRTLFVSEKSEEGGAELKDSLINMIKLGTPLAAVKSLAEQQGFKGDIGKLFSQYSAEQPQETKSVKSKESPSSSSMKQSDASDDPAESFRNFMASQFDDINLPKNKPYGSYRLGNGFEIGFHARKDHLSVHLRSNGKVKAEKVFDWINDKGLTGKKLTGDYVCQPLPGKRDPNVVTAEMHIPYRSKDELNNDELRKQAVELFTALQESFEGIAADLEQTETSQTSQAVDTSDDPVESFREFMAGEFSGMKLPKNKNYGEYVIGSGMLVCFMAKKASVNSYLYSSGKVPAEEVFEKITAQGLNGKMINDKYTITPMPGSRNPNVVRIDLEIPYHDRDLNSAEMRAEVKDVYGQLLELCKPLG